MVGTREQLQGMERDLGESQPSRQKELTFNAPSSTLNYEPINPDVGPLSAAASGEMAPCHYETDQKTQRTVGMGGRRHFERIGGPVHHRHSDKPTPHGHSQHVRPLLFKRNSGAGV